MYRIPPPDDDPGDIYSICTDSISTPSFRLRAQAIKPEVVHAAAQYTALAAAGQLYQFTRHEADNDAIVTGAVTKRELKKLYTQYFVPQTKPGRAIYDALKRRAPRSICPICGSGEVTTLDHYLAKAHYPLFAVCPSNLVPACRDCNTEKLEDWFPTAESQPLHPYFDAPQFFEDEWLAAEVVAGAPVVIRFLSRPPDAWDATAKARVRSHLTSFQLTRRLSVLAAGELAHLKQELSELQDVDARQAHLASRASAARRAQLNGWRRPMLEALRDNAWYCDSGYLEG